MDADVLVTSSVTMILASFTRNILISAPDFKCILWRAGASAAMILAKYSRNISIPALAF